jgi:transcription factor TFIIIB component B''
MPGGLTLAKFNGDFCVMFAETLKFYRALNTVGTDFLLMQSIFPKRTRQDLKMKFKKEDRTNRFLVEKALRYPLDFDLTELEKDLGNKSYI